MLLLPRLTLTCACAENGLFDEIASLINTAENIIANTKIKLYNFFIFSPLPL
jgi:hypothetical protein